MRLGRRGQCWLGELRHVEFQGSLQIATQIALAHKKCKVIAIAGTEDKCRQLRELGCHVVLNYNDKDYAKKLRAAGRIDVYFDNGAWERCNVELTDRSRRRDARPRPLAHQAVCSHRALRRHLAVLGRQALRRDPPSAAHLDEGHHAGRKSHAHSQSSPQFIAFDYEDRYHEGRAYLSDLYNRGLLKYDYYVKEGGLAGCVPAFQDMFAGKNYGKTVVSFVDGGRGAKL